MIIIGCGFCDTQNNQGRVSGYISAETEDWWPLPSLLSLETEIS